MKRLFAELSARARRLLSCLLLCLCACVAACGGGSGGGSSPPSAPPPVVEPRGNLEYGYFATVDNQTAETAAHVTFVMTAGWGDWDSAADRERVVQGAIATLQEAQARGVQKAWVSVDFLLFGNGYRYRGVAELVAFRQRIEALGLGPMVQALYPVDEPDLQGLSGAAMTQILTEIRAVWPEPKLAVIYGDHGWPGLALYDWIGHDDYGRGVGALDRYPPISGTQRWIAVPGGSSPWGQDPQPFYDRANGDQRFAAVMPFKWFDGPAGMEHGIRSNGMANAYCRIGMRIKDPTKEAACP